VACERVKPNIHCAHFKICQISNTWLIIESVCSVTDIFRVIESRRMRWAGHVACMVERRGMWGNLKETGHLGDPGVDGRIILSWIFRKWDVGLWTESSWLRVWTVGGHL